MPDQEQRPVVPTRIIPAGEHLPPEVLADALRPPPRPARPPAPPPPPPVDDRAWEWQPPAPSGPIEVRVTVDLAPSEQDEPSIWSRAWDWATARVRPWALVLAIAGAVVPIPYTGYSVGTTWASTVAAAREFSVPWGYALAGAAFALALTRFIRTGRLIPLFFLVVTFIGLFGAFDWFDPITLITGVRR